jgi:hypothetical protein
VDKIRRKSPRRVKPFQWLAVHPLGIKRLILSTRIRMYSFGCAAREAIIAGERFKTLSENRSLRRSPTTGTD